MLTLRLHRNSQWGVPKVHVVTIIASRSGLKELLKAHPEISVTVGAVDETGLGDAGDRLFGTVHEMEDDQALVHPTKRRRTESIDQA
jgi:uracil phosphoribosyltransferase